MKKLRELIEKEQPPKIIAVGDVVSKNMIERNMHPQVCVIDNLVMRKRIVPFPMDADQTLRIKNPAGTLTKEARSITRKALRRGRQTKIVVDGEEDLLTLPAVLYAPQNSIVVYGQPREGIVVVRVTKQTKGAVQKIVKVMKT